MKDTHTQIMLCLVITVILLINKIVEDSSLPQCDGNIAIRSERPRDSTWDQTCLNTENREGRDMPGIKDMKGAWSTRQTDRWSTLFGKPVWQKWGLQTEDRHDSAFLKCFRNTYIEDGLKEKHILNAFALLKPNISILR